MADFRESERRAELSAILDKLEAVLKQLDLWEDERPPQRLIDSPQPFCFDTLEVHQWLQWLLIPGMRRMLGERDELPAKSAIHPYAEEFFGAQPLEAELLSLLARF